MSLYGLLKFFEFVFFGFYCALEVGRAKNLKPIALTLSASVLFQSLLAISQFINQGSVGGVFYYFGERTFNQGTPGISLVSLSGELVLRSYGTFSHPNVLSGFLILSMTIIIIFSRFPQSRLEKIFALSVLGLGTISLFSTFSRAGIVLWLIIAFYLLIKNRKGNIIFLILTAGFFSVLLTFFYQRFLQTSFSENAFLERLELMGHSLEIARENPLLGVGVLQFIPELSEKQVYTRFTYLFQPVHNILLLVFAETGLLGLFLSVVFVSKSFLSNLFYRTKDFLENLKKEAAVMLLIEMLVLGMVDHFFLTLQQGQLMLSLVLGFSWWHRFKD